MLRGENFHSRGFISSTGKHSFSEEFRKFATAFSLHWPLILSIGFFFGWLLSFPMQGPLFWVMVQGGDVNQVLLTTMLLSGLILGLVSVGLAGYFLRQSLVWFSLGAIPCIAISCLISGVAEDSWWLIFFILGICSGAVIISWANVFASTVSPSQRGRTFVLGAVLSNLVLYLVTILIYNQAGFNLLLKASSILSLSMPVFLIYRYRRMVINNRFASDKIIRTLQVKSRGTWKFIFFVFTIYAVGGLMYAVVGSLSSPSTGFSSYYGLIPYILFLFLAGILADDISRRSNAIIGAISVGIGFMAVGLFTGSLQLVVIQTFLVGGYAFLDAFTWIIAADASGGRKIPLFYGAVLGTNILAILAGVLLCERIAELAANSEILTISLAGILAFVSLAFIIRLKESRNYEVPTVNNLISDSLEPIISKFGLTPRESEVVKLLVAGAGTQDMLEKLVIAPDTLKSHLRSIYHKAGVRNRLELIMAVMNDCNRPDK